MISEALRLLRIYNNLTLEALAKRLSVSKSHLCEIEGGKKKASIDLLERYAAELHVPLSSLFFFAEELDPRNTGDRTRGKLAMTALHLLHKIAGPQEGEHTSEEDISDRTVPPVSNPEQEKVGRASQDVVTQTESTV